MAITDYENLVRAERFTVPGRLPETLDATMKSDNAARMKRALALREWC